MQVDILNIQGAKTGRTIELPEEIFGAEPNNHVIYLAVKQYLAAQRQGTHKVKTRAEVQGSSKKLHKQKGTGGARAGTIKSPLFNGGGRIFGPQPRDYSFKLNKKLKQLARKSALSYKAKDSSIVVLEDFSFDSIKTKNYVKLVTDLKVADEKTTAKAIVFTKLWSFEGSQPACEIVPVITGRLSDALTEKEYIPQKVRWHREDLFIYYCVFRI